LEQGGRLLRGFWLQPSGATADRRDPGGAGQAFATPILLRRGGDGAWHGLVAPLDDRFTLWLSIFRGPDGGLLAAFRNPEENSNGGASRFALTRDGDRLHFGFRYEGGAVDRDATLLHGPDRIRISWPDLGREIELTRRDPAQAASFFPRPPGAPLYAYRAPPAT